MRHGPHVAFTKPQPHPMRERRERDMAHMPCTQNTSNLHQAVGAGGRIGVVQGAVGLPAGDEQHRDVNSQGVG